MGLNWEYSPQNYENLLKAPIKTYCDVFTNVTIKRLKVIYIWYIVLRTFLLFRCNSKFYLQSLPSNPVDKHQCKVNKRDTRIVYVQNALVSSLLTWNKHFLSNKSMSTKEAYLTRITSHDVVLSWLKITV